MNNVQTKGDESNNEKAGGSSGHSTAEWTTLAVSVVIIAGLISIIIFLYLRGADEPPNIVAEARMEQLREEDSGYYLPIDVVNEGDRTVENVTIQAELDMGSGQPQTAEFSVTFLAGGERVHGTFVFTEDPTKGDLTIGAVSYTQP